MPSASRSIRLGCRSGDRAVVVLMYVSGFVVAGRTHETPSVRHFDLAASIELPDGREVLA